MNLIEAFETGKIEGISGLPEKVITTHLSKLFFYPTRVFKVYKYINDAFAGDLSDPSTRGEFITEDFSWNRKMSPAIYLKLHDVGGDYYIEMLRIDDANNLTTLLLNRKIEDKYLEKIGRVMTERSIALTDQNKEKLSDYFAKGWLQLMSDRMKDLRDWGMMAGGKLPAGRCKSVMDKLDSFFNSSSYFKSVPESELSLATDNHSDNVLLINGEVSFIDIYLPKKDWQVVDSANNICRLACDVNALLGKESTEALYRGYSKIHVLPPKEIRNFYEVYNAFLRESYFAMIDRPDMIGYYRDFVDSNIDTIS